MTEYSTKTVTLILVKIWVFGGDLVLSHFFNFSSNGLKMKSQIFENILDLCKIFWYRRIFYGLRIFHRKKLHWFWKKSLKTHSFWNISTKMHFWLMYLKSNYFPILYSFFWTVSDNILDRLRHYLNNPEEPRQTPAKTGVLGGV